MKRGCAILLLAVSAIPGLFAQGPPPGTGLPGGISGNVAPGSDFPSATTAGTPGINLPGVVAAGFVSGKVAMADGSPVPSGLAIARVCAGSSRTVAYTGNKGQFSFQWGQAAQLFPDASDDTGFSRAGPGGNGPATTLNNNLSLSQAPAMACELKVDAPGFRSDVILLHGRGVPDNPNVGTIVLHRLANVEGTSVSATSLAAPSDARKAYEKGLESAAKGKSADAQKDFEKAVAMYPKYANAWLDLARERLKAQMNEPAHEAFLKALAADDKLVAADAELGMMAARAQNWKEAATYLDTAIRLDPVDYPQLRFMDAVADYNVQNYEAAERNVREALKNDPQHPDPQQDQLLGVLLLKKGDLPGGVEALRNYLKLAPSAPDADKVKTEIEQAENAMTPAPGAAH